jgi:hypothetical protein
VPSARGDEVNVVHFCLVDVKVKRGESDGKVRQDPQAGPLRPGKHTLAMRIGYLLPLISLHVISLVYMSF